MSKEYNIGIFEFISGLHEAGMLPVWFLIP